MYCSHVCLYVWRVGFGETSSRQRSGRERHGLAPEDCTHGCSLRRQRGGSQASPSKRSQGSGEQYGSDMANGSRQRQEEKPQQWLITGTGRKDWCPVRAGALIRSLSAARRFFERFPFGGSTARGLGGYQGLSFAAGLPCESLRPVAFRMRSRNMIEGTRDSY